MQLAWVELDETLQLVNKFAQGEVNLNSVASYARRNCKHCHARGFLPLDLGKGYVSHEHSFRLVTCYCVDRHLAKLGETK